MSQVNTRTIRDRVDACMIADQRRLRRRLKGLRRHRNPARELEKLAAIVERSAALRARRSKRLPAVTYDDALPIAARREEISAALRDHDVIVVCGETGSGKTTQLPKICLELGRGVAGTIGVTQPRRIAARAVATRVAEELSSAPGDLVGWKVRFGDQTSADTLVKVMTDGIMLAETQGDRGLAQYDTIIIDEAHERSLNIDFLLGYVRRLLDRRRDLKVIVTSATIDPQRFATHFSDAPIVEVSGRMYPVEVRYRDPAGEGRERDDRDVTRGIVEAVEELGREGGGDVLVFLPGEREIREAARALGHRYDPAGRGARSGTEILPLYARLSNAEQQKVFQPHAGRRIVLATNVAETSLTVPGIRYVVDSGVARISRYSPQRKVQRLPIEAISKASADQRKGRCGRVADGVCIRLFDERDFEKRDAFTAPEILRTSLAGVILRMKALELGAVEAFPFVDPPTRRMIRDGYDTLHELGAVDEQNELTPLGRELAALPVDPRIARMIVAARDEGCLREVLVIAAALSIRDPRDRPGDRQGAADEAHATFRDERSDFMTLLTLWHEWHDRKRESSWGEVRRWCERHFVSFVRMREWLDLHKQLHQLVTDAGMRVDGKPAEPDAIHRALLTGLLANVGMKDDTGYEGARGGAFHLFPGSVLFKRRPAWVAAGELVETTRLYARMVAPIHPEWIEKLAPHLVKRRHEDPRFEPSTGRVVATETVTLYGLPIVVGRTVNYGPIDAELARDIFIHEALVEGALQDDAPFVRHNTALLEDIRALEAKGRRRDLMADTQGRHAFFDQRLGRDVFDAAGLRRWRKQAERRDPQVLFMSREDLLVREETYDHDDFPDHLLVGGTPVPLEYHLEPGAEEDGVTAVVPLPLLNQLDIAQLEWGVRGLLREKVIALIRALPKAVRRSFVPAPNVADRALERFDFGEGRLTTSLGARLEHLTGTAVPPDAWTMETLPAHLRMNVRVVDEEGATLGTGRDPVELRSRLASEASAGFARVAGGTLEASGLTRWSIDALPVSVEVEGAGVTMTGWPALVDEGETVGVRVFDADATARHAHRRGLCRLFSLVCRRDVREHLRALSVMEDIKRLYLPLGEPAQVEDALCLLAVERVFLVGRPDVRDHETFETRLAARAALWDGLCEVADVVHATLEASHRVDLALDRDIPAAWEAAWADVDAHQRALQPDGFLLDVPLDRLRHYPRYLAAMERRLERLGNGGHVRDAESMQVLAPHREAWRRIDERHGRAGTVDGELEIFRWMLEELAVSLFAQELGTAQKISTQRLDKQWAKVAQ